MASAILLCLPAELVQDILSRLPFASHVALRFTCRDLYYKISDPNKTRKYSMSDLLDIETWPRYDHAAQRPENLKQAIPGVDFFGCNQCLRIRSAISFTNAMTRGKYGKTRPLAALTSPPIDKRLGRICIQCGIEEGIYGVDRGVIFGGTQWIHGTVVWHDGKLQLRVDVDWQTRRKTSMRTPKTLKGREWHYRTDPF
jgi:hypothetical protein